MMQNLLIQWFKKNARALPWRKPSSNRNTHRDPYRVWVSEIMLQQTQVQTVVDYYQRWMIKFPDLNSLAEAKEEDVLNLWAGLGYYSRARNMLLCAQQICGDFKGEFPKNRSEILSLKGIGEYTAGAILSLAYNLPEPILDGNLIRVFSRLYQIPFYPESKTQKEIYWEYASKWVQCKSPALVNEGLMELGALVCTPKNPRCSECPLKRKCESHLCKTTDQFPPVKKRKTREQHKGLVLVLSKGRRYGLVKNQHHGLLAKMWSFPFELNESLGRLKQVYPALKNCVLEKTEDVIIHSIMQHDLRLRIVLAEVPEAHEESLDMSWIDKKDLIQVLHNSLSKKVWDRIQKLS
jgi:A/G-specific adenine glycosylase